MTMDKTKLETAVEAMKKDYAGLSHDETDYASGWNSAIDAALALISVRQDEGGELRPEYTQEIADLKTKMIEAQNFAEKFPAFAERILLHKFTSEFTGEIDSRYKGMYFGWGIKRWFYREKSNITNYRGDFEPQYLWNIYINQVSLFGDNYVQDDGLDELGRNIEVFFYDQLNSTFYATDEQIIALLDDLAVWYAKAKEINDVHRKEQKRLDLIKQLSELERSKNG